MMWRWGTRRWWLAGSGWAVAAGLTLAQTTRPEAPPPPPRVGEVITLRFHDGRDRTVKVLKTERQPDGSTLSEVRDVRTGEVFNLLDPPAGAAAPSTAPKGGSRNSKAANSVSLPTPPMGNTDKAPPSNRPLLNLFRPRERDEGNGSSAEAESRPGLIQRLFGRKKETPPERPAPPPALTVPPPANSLPPSVRSPSNGNAPPPVISGRTPAGAPTAPPASFPLMMPQRPAQPPTATPPPVGSPEPPRAQPPATRPATPPPNVTPLPTVPPVPDVPAVPPPAVPAPPTDGLPTIPPPPSGISPAAARQPATPLPDASFPRDLQPYVHALRHATAPSARASAARALADSPQATQPAVQALLLDACQKDPAPFVRACCIDELAKLGCREPAFRAYLRRACEDRDDQVRLAAELALRKLEAAR